MAKERVDVLAYRQGLFETREQAKRGVMAGLVIAAANGQRFDKPGEKIDATTELRLKGEKLRYVSRGGFKLEKALQVFDISVTDQVTLDIGASTGGFTDVMLELSWSMQWMSVLISWLGSSDRMSGSSAWSSLIFAMPKGLTLSRSRVLPVLTLALYR